MVFASVKSAGGELGMAAGYNILASVKSQAGVKLKQYVGSFRAFDEPAPFPAS